MLTASNKLLKVHRGEDGGDDRDSLGFKTVHTIDDFFRAPGRKRAYGKQQARLESIRARETLRVWFPNSPFTRPLNSFLTTKYRCDPDSVQPAALVDSASKMTSLGRGSGPNARSRFRPVRCIRRTMECWTLCARR